MATTAVAAFTAKTTNTQTAAIPVIQGNMYAFTLSGTFNSGVCTLQQTTDETNYIADTNFTAMSVAGIVRFTATGDTVKFTLASGGGSMSLNGTLKDLGGVHTGKNADFSRLNTGTVRTNP